MDPHAYMQATEDSIRWWNRPAAFLLVAVAAMALIYIIQPMTGLSSWLGALIGGVLLVLNHFVAFYGWLIMWGKARDRGLFRNWAGRVFKNGGRIKQLLFISVFAVVALDLICVASGNNEGALADVAGYATYLAVAVGIFGGVFHAHTYSKDANAAADLSRKVSIKTIHDPDPVTGRWKVDLLDNYVTSFLPSLQKYAEGMGMTVYDYDLRERYDKWAILDPITEREAIFYSDAAQNFSKPVYEFAFDLEWSENEDRFETCTVQRAPFGGLSPEDREKFLIALRDTLPGGNEGCTIDDPQLTQGADRARAPVIRYGKPPKFDEDVLYDWDAPLDYDRIPFAVDLKGEPVTLKLIESNMLLGGLPGGGKSGGLTAIITDCARLPHVALVGLDPKRVEQADWRPRFTHVAVTLDDALATLDALTNEMDRRYDMLVDQHKKKVKADMISDEMPLIVVVADEMAELVAMGITKDELAEDKERIKNMQRLVQKGRAAGIVFVGATQKPEGSVIPTNFRDRVAQRVAYATTNADMTDTILGRGMSTNGGVAHAIEANQKGVCFVVNDESRTPIKARTMWVPDEDIARIADETKHLRVSLPFLESALGLTAPELRVEPIAPDEPTDPDRDDIRPGEAHSTSSQAAPDEVAASKEEDEAGFRFDRFFED